MLCCSLSFSYVSINQFSFNLLEFQDEKIFFLAITFLFCNATQAAVYMIDFKCEPEAYEVLLQ